jgi:anti-anti-sigma regulatory factor
MGCVAESGRFGKVLVRIEGSMDRARARKLVRKLARLPACELVLDLALAEPLDDSGARALVDACRALGLIRVISFAGLSDEESALLGEAGFACVQGVD